MFIQNRFLCRVDFKRRVITTWARKWKHHLSHTFGWGNSYVCPHASPIFSIIMSLKYLFSTNYFHFISYRYIHCAHLFISIWMVHRFWFESNRLVSFLLYNQYVWSRLANTTNKFKWTLKMSLSIEHLKLYALEWSAEEFFKLTNWMRRELSRFGMNNRIGFEVKPKTRCKISAR